jgi:hypothetical protein
LAKYSCVASEINYHCDVVTHDRAHKWINYGTVEHTYAVSLGVYETTGTFYMKLNDYRCAIMYDGTTPAGDGSWHFVTVAWSSSTATAM